MNDTWFQIAVLFGLLLANGFFAMAEIAVVSARKGKLRALAERGDNGAAAALALAENPQTFLSTVQVMITLLGIAAGTYGAATLAAKVAPLLAQWAPLAPYAEVLALVVVAVALTFASVVLGELVPKRVGLVAPEAIAVALTGPMKVLATLAGPAVGVLNFSTEALVKVLRLRAPAENHVSEEEVVVLVKEGTEAGVFQQAESEMVQGVLALDQLTVGEIMTPRPKMVWLNVDDTGEPLWRKIVAGNHSYFPVYRDSRENYLGIVSLKSIFANLAAGIPVRLADLVMPALTVSEDASVIEAIEQFKSSGKHIAIALDEFYSPCGIVSLTDVIEAIAGDFPSQEERRRPSATQRADGSWLFDATLDFESLCERLGVAVNREEEEEREFVTVGGFVLDWFGEVPKEGDNFVWEGWKIEVIDMDRYRVDKVLATRVPPAPPPEEAAPPGSPPAATMEP